MYYDIGNHWKYGQPGEWLRAFGTRAVKLDVKGFSRAKNQFVEIGGADDDLPWDQVRKAISDTRWTNNPLLTSQKGLPISVTGKAGTLVLFDTSLLHRGSPNSNGLLKSRVALTNYYYPIIGSIGDRYAN
jgi:hypothetical protein